jgi:peptidoglycan/xylan/chitin deacetylase (PgdA/CDA1 family)
MGLMRGGIPLKTAVMAAAWLLAWGGAWAQSPASLGAWEDRPLNREGCHGRADALGTHRVLTVDPADSGIYGRVQGFPTLDLEPGEFVLTFDDGPRPSTTRSVLRTLASHCVRATFFVVGQRALMHPEVLSEIVDHGHTIGSHSWSHAYLGRHGQETGEWQISRGHAAADEALEGARQLAALRPRIQFAPFFRFPGLEHTQALLDYTAEKGMAVFSCDVCAEDWKRRTPEHVRDHTLGLMARAGKGIVILHDIHQRTADMLPDLLDELVVRGWRVVHIVPERAVPPASDAASVSKPRE